MMDPPYVPRPQVSPAHYRREGYTSLRRWGSYWHQIDLLRALNPTSILEIGIGNRTVSDELRKLGFPVTTLDLDPSIGPDLQASVHALPLRERSFEVVAAFEVLEHLPYAAVPRALEEIHRVAARHAVLSLPDASKAYRIYLHVPYRGEIRRAITIPAPRKRAHTYDGEHYWEIGKDGYPLRRIYGDLARAGFIVRANRRYFEEPYHRFFTLERAGSQ